ncbi:Uncharacterised protein [Segatella copri]|nr:Uncharacterised protein [Segatella copri]
MGKGKLEEIKEYIKNEEEEDREVGMVIFEGRVGAIPLYAPSSAKTLDSPGTTGWWFRIGWR